MKKEKIVVFTGAGVSAESGVATFRDENGLWNNHRIEDVATPEGWLANPELVLDFYNQRRRQMWEVEPNAAHVAIAQLEEAFEVVVITQNVDNLHERGGSTQVLHLHGELDKVHSVKNPNYVRVQNGADLNWGDLCPQGGQLRPHIVWFGEAVPAMDEAVQEIQTADRVMVVGSSLQVYPAAGLVNFASKAHTKVLITKDLDHPPVDYIWHASSAASKVPEVVQAWLAEAK